MIRLQRLLFGVAASFWLVAGALAVLGLTDFGLTDGARVLGVLMLGNGLALGLAGWFSLHGHPAVDYGALAVVAANAILSVTDEIGLLDLVSLLVSGALLALLIVNMYSQRYRQKAQQS